MEKRSVETSPRTPEAIRRNIDAIVKLEESFIQNRNLADRLADSIGGFTGSVTFVILHVIFYGAWVLINLGMVPGVPLFDKYPFLLLSVVVSLEAIFLSTFVLMKQNRMSRQADQRDHLDLQINLLTEKEITLVLQLLQRMAVHSGMEVSGEHLDDLSAETSVEALAEQIAEKLSVE